MNAAIITGSTGGIGKALVKEFHNVGFYTIGIDLESSTQADVNIKCDLVELVNNETIQENLYKQVEKVLKKRQLIALINNAAVQMLGNIEQMSLSDFKKTIDVNLTSSFLLSKMFFNMLMNSKGSIINIGSIHAKLTKPEFIAYATSKAALRGLTQAMAVDFGKLVRVNIIEPAAIYTPMLLDGFNNNPQGLLDLETYHPIGRIGEPAEVAKLALFLASEDSSFINGACIGIDGAISSRLHDPA